MAHENLEASDEVVAFDNEGFLRSDDVRTGLISGRTFTDQAVQYAAVDNLAVFEGDIILGKVDDLVRTAALATATDDGAIAHGVVISGDQYRWPGALMPYEIDPSLPNKQRVTTAINEWKAKVGVNFVERTAANASQYPNYVRVFRDNGCYSSVGMRGGRQDISLADGCGIGAAIHEFGHAWGVWHEQSREDRNSYVTINWANIENSKTHNFNQHISDGDDLGSYDYGSIMHYGKYAFSKNGLPTIEPKQAGKQIGQRTGLSAGDVAAIQSIYELMRRNLTVSRTYATTNAKNAWVSFSGVGWRRIDPATNDGVTDILAICSIAKMENRKVDVRMDGQKIYNAYMS